MDGLQWSSVRGGDILLLTTACRHPQMLEIFQRATSSNYCYKRKTKSI